MSKELSDKEVVDTVRSDDWLTARVLDRKKQLDKENESKRKEKHFNEWC